MFCFCLPFLPVPCGPCALRDRTSLLPGRGRHHNDPDAGYRHPKACHTGYRNRRPLQTARCRSAASGNLYRFRKGGQSDPEELCDHPHPDRSAVFSGKPDQSQTHRALLRNRRKLHFADRNRNRRRLRFACRIQTRGRFRSAGLYRNIDLNFGLFFVVFVPFDLRDVQDRDGQIDV